MAVLSMTQFFFVVTVRKFLRFTSQMDNKKLRAQFLNGSIANQRPKLGTGTAQGPTKLDLKKFK